MGRRSFVNNRTKAVPALHNREGIRLPEWIRDGTMTVVMDMELPKRKRSRLEDYDYSQAGVYFVTVCTHDRKRILSKISVGTPLPGCPQKPYPELSWHGEIADKMIRQMDSFYKHLLVDKYVIMPDHIHFLIVIPNGHPGRGVPTRMSAIARFIGTFKRFCNKEYGKNIWQSRYYDHVVRNQEDYNAIWEYIEYNPTKWYIEKQKEKDESLY